MEDTINVVRCKDCVFRMYSYICPMKNIYYDGDNEVVNDLTNDNGYCDLGKKKSVKSFNNVVPTNQISTMFNLNNDKSHALPFSPSGLSYDYWVL